MLLRIADCYHLRRHEHFTVPLSQKTRLSTQTWRIQEYSIRCLKILTYLIHFTPFFMFGTRYIIEVFSSVAFSRLYGSEAVRCERSLTQTPIQPMRVVKGD